MQPRTDGRKISRAKVDKLPHPIMVATIDIDAVIQTGISWCQGVCTKIRCLGNNVNLGTRR